MYLNDCMRTKIVNGSELFNLTEVPPEYFINSAMKTMKIYGDLAGTSWHRGFSWQ